MISKITYGEADWMRLSGVASGDFSFIHLNGQRITMIYSSLELISARKYDK